MDDHLRRSNTSSSSQSKPRRPERDLPPLPDQVDAATDRNEHTLPPSVTEEPEQDATTTEDATRLTPIRAHYLKKTLVTLQVGRELHAITTAPTVPNLSTLSYLGPPFSAPPRDAPPIDLPFLKFIFRQFVLTFPFLSQTPRNFYSEKLEPFVASALARNLVAGNALEDSADDSEQASRKKLITRMEKQVSLMYNLATKLVEPESVVRLTQADLNRIETLARKRNARLAKNKTVFEVNIVCIRAIVNKGRVRSKVHEEFIIRTRRTNFPDVYVSRRYGDFRSLAEELRKRYPDENVRPPPSKDKSTVTASAASPTTAQMPNPISTQSNDSQESVASFATQQVIQNIRLAREKNRLTLRAYLHSLLSNRELASSPVLLHFLLSNPTQLSRDEQEDARRREEADRKRDEGRIRFAHEIAARVEGLRTAIKSVKNDVMLQDGLTNVIKVLRVTDNVRDLPLEYQAVFEWGRVTLASTLFQHFIASDDATTHFSAFKRLHGLVPYFVLKGILKISNPVAMVRSILDLFLAQPFGGRSLLQRMFTNSLSEEVKFIEEDIEALKEKIEDDMICEKIRQFVYAPKEIQDIYKADAALENLNLLTVILRSGEQPALSRPQLHRVMRAHRAHLQYLEYRSRLADSDDDEGPQDEDAWLYEDLTILTKLYTQLRNKEQIMELVFEGTTAELLKDIITIFYSPLAQVYKAAGIADSLGDLQSFLNDLIKTVEAAADVSHEQPHQVVQMFIDLVERHEQNFYCFIHRVHANGQDLFDSMMRWVELFITLFRDGVGGQAISLEFLLPHSGPERLAVMKEIDEIALYHYKLKLAHEDKLRRRFGKAQGQAEADAEDETTQMLVNGVVNELSFGELANGEVEDMAAALNEDSGSSGEGSDDDDDDDDDDESDEDSSSYETATDTSGTEESRTDGVNHTPTKSSTHAIAAPVERLPSSSRQHQTHPHSSHNNNNNERRGRDEGRAQKAQGLRSRSRSITALKSMFTRSSQDAPPVPPLPNTISPSSAGRFSESAHSPRHMPPSPLSARPSQDSARSPIVRRTPPQGHRPRKNKGLELKQPDLKELPNLLPIFVEMMRPLLRPQGI